MEKSFKSTNMTAAEALKATRNRNRSINKYGRQYIAPSSNRLDASGKAIYYGTQSRINRKLYKYIIKKKEEELKINRLLDEHPPGPIYIDFIVHDHDTTLFTFPYYRGMSFNLVKLNLLKLLNKNIYQYDIDLYTFDEDDEDYETEIKINDLISLLEEWENDIYISIELI